MTKNKSYSSKITRREGGRKEEREEGKQKEKERKKEKEML